MTFAEARAAYPVLERIAYLNAGTTGPIASATVEAMQAQLQRERDDGRGGSRYWEELRALRERVRAAVATLVGAAPEQVAVAHSTTAAVNTVVAGLRLAPDDEVVTTDEEHFGLIGPLHASGARVRIAATRGLPRDEALAALLAEVGPRTRLLALSHVSWMTGALLPVAELKEATGLAVLVDGAQSAGAIPIVAAAFDYYTVSGQKWLCGPDGTGALVVADPERLPVAAPSYLSQAGYESTGAFTPAAGAARVDAGTVGATSLVGLEAALAAAPEWRFDRSREAVERCRELLAQRFDVVTPPGQSNLVSFRPDGDPAEAVSRLYERGVVVRNIPRTEWVRVSCGYWTSDKDLERLLDSL
jgi:L-cysteine/cystine lyase